MGRLSKVKWCLSGCLIIVLTLIASSVFVPDKLGNTLNWLTSNDLAGKLRTLTKQEARPGDNLVEMTVESIRVSKVDYQPVVVLKQKGGEVYLPIWIGLVEANAISVILEGVKMPRPLTADLLCSAIDRTGASVNHIIISDLQNNVFYANIILNANRTQIEIDARPSDAIAVALRAGAPIYVTKAVLEKAGVPSGHETDKYTTIHLEIDKTKACGGESSSAKEKRWPNLTL